MGALLSLGSFAGCVACGICSCCIGKTINLCCFQFECNHSHGTRIGYFLFFVITSALALIFGNWGAPALYKLSFIEKCSADTNSLADGCFGDLIIMKIIFGGVLFHFLQFILTLGVKDLSDKRASIQNGFWPLKFFILLGLIVAAIFIPNPFYVYYVWVSFICAGIFIIYQLILIVDFAHKFNDYLVSQLDEDKRCLAVLLSGTFLFFAIALVFNLLIWILFSKGDSCKMNIGFSVSNLIICAIISIISITPYVQERNEYSSSLFTSSVVTLYTSYLIWSAVFSEPTEYGCVPSSGSEAAHTVAIIIGAIITLFAVAWSTVNAASNEEGKELTSAISGDVSHKDDEEGEKLIKSKEEDDDDEIKMSGPVEYNYALFHLIFAFGYMYMACLLTNWRLVTPGTGSHSIAIDESIVSVWIKVVSSWLTLGLYLWTIINSCVCPDRKFR